MEESLVVANGDGEAIGLDDREALLYLPLLDRALVSACPECRSRVVAALAFADVLDDAPPLDATDELRELVDTAPTLHLYVFDAASSCTHRAWRDPGYDEWADMLDEFEE